MIVVCRVKKTSRGPARWGLVRVTRTLASDSSAHDRRRALVEELLHGLTTGMYPSLSSVFTQLRVALAGIKEDALES